MPSLLQQTQESRVNAAEVAIAAHRDAIRGRIFLDDDPAMNLSQLLASLQLYAKENGINFEAALEGDDDRLYDVDAPSAVPGR